MRVVSYIDPLKGQRYTEPIYNEGQGDYLDQIYNVTTLEEDHINPTTDGNPSWKSASSCTSDSGEALENWKNPLPEVSMRRCAKVTRFVRQAENELREFPTYEGLPNLATFLTEFESIVIESQHLSALDHVLKATTSRWWGMHKPFIKEWPQCRRLMEVRFNEEVLIVSHK